MSCTFKAGKSPCAHSSHIQKHLHGPLLKVKWARDAVVHYFTNYLDALNMSEYLSRFGLPCFTALSSIAVLT
jgi:hypothetical protein